MRLDLHFQNSDGEILDDTGLELVDAADVRSQTLRALEELRTENPQLFESVGLAGECRQRFRRGSFLARAGVKVLDIVEATS